MHIARINLINRRQNEAAQRLDLAQPRLTRRPPFCAKVQQDGAVRHRGIRSGNGYRTSTQKGWTIVDAGWMALSRDRGTAAQAVDQGYGVVCDLDGTPTI